MCVSVEITSTAGPVLLVPNQCQGGGGAGIRLRQLSSPSHDTNKPGPLASFTTDVLEGANYRVLLIFFPFVPIRLLSVLL